MYKPGEWWITCDTCSMLVLAGESKKQHWNGLIVCSNCYEDRHPQEFVRARPDKITAPFTRNPPDVFSNSACSMEGRSGYTGIGTAGCMIAGNTMFSVADLLREYICNPTSRLPHADQGTADCATVGP